MDWLEVTVYTTNSGIEPVSGRLYQVGIGGVSIEDETEFLDFLENNKGSWDYVDDELMESMHKETTVKFYVPMTADGMETLAAAKASLAELKEYDKDSEFGRLEVDVANLKEEDWANNWKQYFKPVKIGEKLVIKPSWEEYENDGSRIILEIDPASSFGTGQHHTTRLCLELLEKSLNSGDRILDMGCGSGILSIGAMLLGAESAVAVDIEQNATETAMENAVKNNISPEKYETFYGNILTDEKLADRIDAKYDVIAANIVADVLIAMKDHFVRYIKKGGILIVSGIIEERMHEVIGALEGVGFSNPEINVKEGWAAVKLAAPL